MDKESRVNKIQYIPNSTIGDTHLHGVVTMEKDGGKSDMKLWHDRVELNGVAYMHGVDKEGHPVCYNIYGVFEDKELYNKTFGDDAKHDKFLQWRD
ncbi:hypothetical protein SUGI_0601750 [Cryptomeria japonica]|nr:hypothetical protein SUGI_0601750 [Cryptomeria japonica]